MSEGEIVALLVAQKALGQYRGTPYEQPLKRAFQKIAESLQDRVLFQWEEITFEYRKLSSAGCEARLRKSKPQRTQRAQRSSGFPVSVISAISAVKYALSGKVSAVWGRVLRTLGYLSCSGLRAWRALGRKMPFSRITLPSKAMVPPP